MAWYRRLRGGARHGDAGRRQRQRADVRRGARPHVGAGDGGRRHGAGPAARHRPRRRRVRGPTVSAERRRVLRVGRRRHAERNAASVAQAAGP